MILVTLDCETGLICADEPLPPVICMGVCMRDDDGEILRWIYAGPDVLPAFNDLLDNPNILIVNQSIAFDLGCLWRTFRDEDPTLITRIFAALRANRMSDIGIREKLINLATHGNLDIWITPDGVAKRAEYNLAALVRKHLGAFREKGTIGDDTWRTNFALLAGKPVEEYPQEALDYLNLDISDPLEVYESQEQVAELEGVLEPLHACEHFRTRFDFCLKLISHRGFFTDEPYKDSLKTLIEEEYDSPKCMALLVKHKLMTPAKPARPKKNGTGMTKPQKAKKNAKAMQDWVKAACIRHGIEIRETPTGNVAVSHEVFVDLEGLDPVLDQYIERQKLEKLATTEIPRMSGGPVVRPNFDVLKKTGRISAFAGKNPLYPAFNSQNVHPRARKAFIARPGHVLVSADYSANELVSAAQVYLRVVGRSMLAEVINAGIGPHEYLGAQLAACLDDGFGEHVRKLGLDTEMAIYLEFMKLKDGSDADKKFYKHYRTFAKPTGLGYPGGLGPKTFVRYAKATYGVETDETTAYQLREVWRSAYPEVREFFAWLNSSAVDPRDPSKYAYTTPMGMLRSGCSYTEAANGMALQSQSAEWMALACCRIVEEQHDPSMDSVLYGTYTLSPVHDEIIAEIPDDDLKTERALRFAVLMIESGEEIAPDLTHNVEPALMRRWNKSAEPVWDAEAQELRVWEEPK